MRQTLTIAVLLAAMTILPGCPPIVFAGIAVAIPLVQREMRDQQNARRIELARQERLRMEAEKKAVIEQQQLARRRAEMLHWQKEAETRRRFEQKERDRKNRQQLASLPNKAARHSRTLVNIRRELGEIAEDAIETRRKLLKTNLTK